MIFSPLSLSSPPFSLVLCDLRRNSPELSKQNGATKGFNAAARGSCFFLLIGGYSGSLCGHGILQVPSALDLLHPSLRGAQRRSNPDSSRELDCFVAVLLAM